MLTKGESNKVTGANVGGLRPLAVLPHWAARIAWFWC